MEPRLRLDEGGPDDWNKQIEDWETLGATHISYNTMGAGLSSPQDHIDAIRHFSEVIQSGKRKRSK
jgi:hypothetical protein